MDISGETARLAIFYWKTAQDEEHPREAGAKLGFTPLELGNRRRKAHDALMTQLRAERFVFPDRASVTEWTEQFIKWIGCDYGYED